MWIRPLRQTIHLARARHFSLMSLLITLLFSAFLLHVISHNRKFLSKHSRFQQCLLLFHALSVIEAILDICGYHSQWLLQSVYDIHYLLVIQRLRLLMIFGLLLANRGWVSQRAVCGVTRRRWYWLLLLFDTATLRNFMRLTSLNLFLSVVTHVLALLLLY